MRHVDELTTEYLPAAQLTHVAPDDEAITPENLPAWHAVHVFVLAATTSEYFPFGQLVHALYFAYEYVPALQLAHEDMPDVEELNLPAVQSVHAELFVKLNVPFAQMVHTELLVTLKVPPSQRVHVELPFDERWPAAQFWHAEIVEAPVVG